MRDVQTACTVPRHTKTQQAGKRQGQRKWRALVKDVGRTALDRDVLEADVLPGGGRVLHHHVERIVELVILFVEEGQLVPELLLLAGANEARDVDAGGEELQVLHKLGRRMVRVPAPGTRLLEPFIRAVYCM